MDCRPKCGNEAPFSNVDEAQSSEINVFWPVGFMIGARERRMRMRMR